MKKIYTIICSIILASLAGAQDCSELFISEYVEGPNNNNAIEIYNPTASAIDLSEYLIKRYSNGASTSSESWPLSGSIASGQAIAIGNGQLDSVWVNNSYWSVPVDPVFLAACDYSCSGIYPTPFYFNGNDAITLEKINGDIIDIFGKVGEDPGDSWSCDTSGGFTTANSISWNYISERWWTKRQTLVRKSSVKKGVTQNPILFNPTAEYDSLPDATYSGMGSHSCDCAVSSVNYKTGLDFSIYPNPMIQGESIQIISSKNNYEIRLFDMTGNLISSRAKINFSLLSSGFYLVELKHRDGSFNQKKLIVQ
ncbi:MAG: hypothetical protein CMP71_01890 [Flavobacteriales bacterium]|nr:hypothetical protein [Flavobacteriales bacterium]|tara:strand:+ start:14002 stop:14931 length:930 start_codon:yes stop_codon:yes gene_type:complete